MRIDLEDPSPDDLAAAVRALLNGGNKTTAARAVGVSRQTLYRWEQGLAQPSIQELSDLTKHVGGEVDIVLNRQSPSIEDQMADLRRQLGGLYEGRAVVADIIEHLGGSDDPEVKALLVRLKSLDRRQQ